MFRILRKRTQRGSMSIEAVILTPIIAFLILFVVAVGRYALALQSVQNASNAAARDASLARDTTDASTQAEQGATAAMNSQGPHCASMSVAIDPSGIDAPLGSIGTVRATVSCTVSLGDISIPGLPGSIHIEKSATSPVDPYRERS